MSFENLLEKIDETKKLATMEIDGSNPSTLNMRIGMKRKAKEDLEELFLEYRKEVLNNVVFMLVNGDESDKVISICKKDFNCFTSNSDDMLITIADEIHEANYLNQSSSSKVFDLIQANFEKIARDIGISSFKAMLFDTKYQRILKSKDDLISLMRDVFTDIVGSEAIGVFAIDKAAHQAINEGYKGKTVPVMINVKDEKLLNNLLKDLSLISRNVFLISAGKVENEKLLNQSTVTIEKVSKKEIESALIAIKKNIN